MKHSYLEIIKTSVPLVLSTSGFALMMFIDAMFLAWYSPISLAATGSSGCISWAFSCFLLGLVSYTSALTSNYIGAKMPSKVGCAIWQGIYISIGYGFLAFCLSFGARRLFLLCGHDPALAHQEGQYLKILLMGSSFNFAQAALSGFFSGRKDNTRLMIASLTGHVSNVVMDYILVFGKLGLPSMGIEGAALATILSQIITCILLLYFFLTRENRLSFNTWQGKKLNWDMLMHLLKFGSPNGLQQLMDAGTWSLFTIIMGRFGPIVLAATTTVFRLNSLALQPVVGLAKATSAFIGQAHGARNHKETIEYTKKGTILCAIVMSSIAATFVLIPEVYLNLFFKENHPDYDLLMQTSKHLLYFVSLYCLLDSFNISLCTALQTVGDTKWVSVVLSSAAALLSTILVVAEYKHASFYTIWTFATIYVMILPPFWIWRMRQGKWKNIIVAK